MNISAKTIVENYISQYEAANEVYVKSVTAAYEAFKRQYAAGLSSGPSMEKQKDDALEAAKKVIEEAGQDLNEKITKSIEDFKNAFIKAYNGAEPDSQRIANCITFLRAEGDNISAKQVNAIISDCGCTGNMDTLRRLKRIVELQSMLGVPVNGYESEKAKSAKCFEKLSLYDGVIYEISKLAEVVSRLFIRKPAVSKQSVFIPHDPESVFLDDVVPERGRELYLPMITISELFDEGTARNLADEIDEKVAKFEEQLKNDYRG